MARLSLVLRVAAACSFAALSFLAFPLCAHCAEMMLPSPGSSPSQAGDQCSAESRTSGISFVNNEPVICVPAGARHAVRWYGVSTPKIEDRPARHLDADEGIWRPSGNLAIVHQSNVFHSDDRWNFGRRDIHPKLTGAFLQVGQVDVCGIGFNQNSASHQNSGERNFV